jgi:RNA:NAD 2'-phosphotransferase (TPT1/KptA family)
MAAQTLQTEQTCKERFMETKLDNTQVKISKFLSLVLRHSPAIIHLNMDKNGWVSIQELIDNANKYKRWFTKHGAPQQNHN